MFQGVGASSGDAVLCLGLAYMWGISFSGSIWSGRSQLCPLQLSFFSSVCSGLLSEYPPSVLNVHCTELWAGVSAPQGCDPPQPAWVLGPWVSKDAMTFFLAFHGWWRLKKIIRPRESRCISLLQLWLGDMPGGQILACKVCHWSAVGSEAAGGMSKGASFSDPPSFVCWERAPSTQLLWAFSLIHCISWPHILDMSLTCKWVLDVDEEQDRAAHGGGGSMPATALQQTRSLTGLDRWVHNSPLPDLVNFLSRETQILVKYAGIQTGTVTIVTADCRGETVSY